MSDGCIFCKIAAKEIDVAAVFENDEFVAFRDLHPQAPVHVLLIPKKHYRNILEVEDEALLGRACKAIQQTVSSLGLTDPGFRVVLNCGADGGQTVDHIHWHLMGGRRMQWPPG